LQGMLVCGTQRSRGHSQLFGSAMYRANVSPLPSFRSVALALLPKAGEQNLRRGTSRPLPSFRLLCPEISTASRILHDRRLECTCSAAIDCQKTLVDPDVVQHRGHRHGRTCLLQLTLLSHAASKVLQKHGRVSSSKSTDLALFKKPETRRVRQNQAGRMLKATDNGVGDEISRCMNPDRDTRPQPG
jgi:hypothetical protein